MMASVTLNKIRGEYRRSGTCGVIAAILRCPGRWLRAWSELGRYRTFDSSPALLAYTRALAEGWFDPMQIDAEICAMLDRLRDLRPATILEIGTANGGTLFMYTRIAHPHATIISLDLPGGSFGGGYPAWRSPLYRRFALPGQQIILLRGNSHARHIRDEVERRLAGRSLDFLFIDGDHTYDGVKSDFEQYSPLVRASGLIGFHDIHPSDDDSTEVSRYWVDFAAAHRTESLISNRSQCGYGIGLYTKTPQ